MAMELSHIWLGVFGKNAPENYFKEIYDEDDSKPLSLFVGEQGETWVDHDWMERSVLPVPVSIEQIAKGHSYSVDYLELLIENSQVQGIEVANVFVMLDQKEIKRPVSVQRKDYHLHYMGVYKCKT